MKKIVVCLLAAFLVAGCSGGSNSKKVSKTCGSGTDEMEMNITVEAKDSKSFIDKALMTQVVPYEYMGVDKDEMSDTDKKDLEDQIKSSFAAFGDDAEVNITWGKKNITVEATLPKEQLATLTGEEDITVKEFADLMSEQGATCK